MKIISLSYENTLDCLRGDNRFFLSVIIVLAQNVCNEYFLDKSEMYNNPWLLIRQTRFYKVQYSSLKTGNKDRIRIIHLLSFGVAD